MKTRFDVTITRGKSQYFYVIDVRGNRKFSKEAGATLEAAKVSAEEFAAKAAQVIAWSPEKDGYTRGFFEVSQ